MVQGTTRPEPFETAVRSGPHARTIEAEPVSWFAQTCNILYPRAVLDQLGGFDERTLTAEDVELGARARAAGSPIVPEPRAVVFHAIESHTLPGIVRRNLHRRDVPYVLGRHPELRPNLRLRLFLKNVRRPGIAAVMPTIKGPCVLLDVGANVHPKPEHLYQYGVMGSIFAKHILQRERPTIGLLNVGNVSGTMSH